MIERHPSIDPVHPGEILREDILPATSMSNTAIADALGISRQTLYDIFNEKQPVTAEIAVRFGKGASFWMNLQHMRDLAFAERTVDVSRIPDPRGRHR
jgi:addiction module HigA family antidote